MRRAASATSCQEVFFERTGITTDTDMQLILETDSWCDRATTDRQRRHFDRFPIVIGRSVACDYSLEDASRYISSNHAVIMCNDRQLLIEDTSANGVYLNGHPEPLGRGNRQALRHGDTLTIGDYVLIVRIEQDIGADRPAQAPDTDDPFADMASSTTRAVVPDDPAGYDPFKGGEPDWTPRSQSVSGSERSARDPAAQQGSPDPAVSASDSLAGDVFADPFTGRWETDASPQIDSTDSDTGAHWADWIQDDSPQTPSSARQVAPAPSITEDAPGASVTTTGSVSEALAILLQAAEVRQQDLAHVSDERTLAQTGRLLAQMVDAMMVLLQSRMELKNHIRSDVTTLSRTDNNPLKFSFDASDALTKLLSERADGYLPPEQAVAQAVEDLKLHQLAMLDGMKSAVQSVLLQFDPQSLSRKLERSGGISANIPITREAKLWEMFREQYETIRDEAMDDFTEVYGREFRKAYEARVRKATRSTDT